MFVQTHDTPSTTGWVTKVSPMGKGKVALHLFFPWEYTNWGDFHHLSPMFTHVNAIIDMPALPPFGYYPLVRFYGGHMEVTTEGKWCHINWYPERWEVKHEGQRDHPFVISLEKWAKWKGTTP